MAEIAIDAVKVLVEKLISVAAEEVGFILGFKNELKKLGQRLRMIQDNLLDEFNYEIIRSKVEIQTQMKQKLCCCFSSSVPSSVAFRSDMGHEIKDVNMKLISINEEASSYGLRSR
ncbi:uncharacterized protein LOC142550803 [Primulina tabacum]|uniref:uncharacterized protein LOC142550803 n=1 Tax=Primulina tabacum TaxID=48773 RepID=UPI003F595209